MNEIGPCVEQHTLIHDLRVWGWAHEAKWNGFPSSWSQRDIMGGNMPSDLWFQDHKMRGSIRIENQKLIILTWGSMEKINAQMLKWTYASMRFLVNKKAPFLKLSTSPLWKGEGERGWSLLWSVWYTKIMNWCRWLIHAGKFTECRRKSTYILEIRDFFHPHLSTCFRDNIMCWDWTILAPPPCHAFSKCCIRKGSTSSS